MYTTGVYLLQLNVCGKCDYFQSHLKSSVEQFQLHQSRPGIHAAGRHRTVTEMQQLPIKRSVLWNSTWKTPQFHILRINSGKLIEKSNKIDINSHNKNVLLIEHCYSKINNVFMC